MDRYFFIHIPKTAGTSFRELLTRQFRGWRRYPSRGELRRNDFMYPGLDALAGVSDFRRSQIRLVAGHYEYGSADAIFQEPTVRSLTMLREPVSRTISNLLHLQRHSLKLQELPIEEIFERSRRETRNVQVRMIAGVHRLPEERDLETAKENLQRCDFVGLTEEFANSVEIANHRFGWKLGAPVRRNMRPSDSLALAEELSERIRHANSLDIQLHHFARRLFHEQLADMGRAKE